MSDDMVKCSYKKLVDVIELVEHPKNPNQHSAKQIDLLARVIKAQGWRNPITVSNNSGYIISGHGRLLAAKKLGIKQVPVDYQDFENQAEETAHLLADNRIAELAELNNDYVSELIEQLADIDFDLDLTGFDADAIKKLLDMEEDQAEVDEVEEKFEIIVECKNETEQKESYDKLKKEGYQCRVLTF